MNFLAHLSLSGDNPRVMVGNFIGDFVKGRKSLEQFDADIVHGVGLHRAIDSFTDTHPVVTQSKRRLHAEFRHYAGVIVDVFYDHYLARNWSTYYEGELADFARHCYRTLEEHNTILPERVQHMLPYMKRDNWLVGYSYTDGIHQALSGMSRRTRYESGMDHAVEALRGHYDAFGEEFASFYPELQRFAEQWRNGEAS